MIYGFDPPSVVYTGPVDDENAHDFFKQSPGAFFLPPEWEGSENYTFVGIYIYYI